MRIIAGRWRGRTIAAPRGRDTRPTTDRVREAIFSSVYSLFGDLEGATVLDLYAGSGALGLEALSRGAQAVVFVESDRRAASVISSNIKSIGAAKDQARVVQAQANTALSARLAGVRASLLLADPPYRIDAADFGQVLQGLAAAGVLEQGALVMYEHSSSSEPRWPEGFVPVSDRTYGDTAVSFASFEGEPAT